MSDYYDIDTGADVTDSDAHDMFDEYLDDVLEEVTIGTLTYTPSYALKELDPIAYRCEFSDWTSEHLSESGYWVRVLTSDGELYGDGPEWFTEEDDARDAFATLVELLTDPDADDVAGLTVQLHDTSDDVIAEQRIAVSER